MSVVTGKAPESSEGPSSLQELEIVLCEMEGGTKGLRGRDGPHSFGLRSLIKSATFGLKRSL